jgi:fructose-specific component phosphotransferase system IIB-like protein
MNNLGIETGNDAIDGAIEKTGNFLSNAFSKAVEYVQENPEAVMGLAGATAGFVLGGGIGAAIGAGIGYLASQFFNAADPVAQEKQQRVAAVQEATGVQISGQQTPAVDASATPSIA